MALLRSAKELLEQYDALSAYVLEHNEPVFLSDGTPEHDIVLLSYTQYGQLTGAAALKKLMADMDSGEKHPSVDVLAELAKLDEGE